MFGSCYVCEHEFWWFARDLDPSVILFSLTSSNLLISSRGPITPAPNLHAPSLISHPRGSLGLLSAPPGLLERKGRDLRGLEARGRASFAQLRRPGVRGPIRGLRRAAPWSPRVSSLGGRGRALGVSFIRDPNHPHALSPASFHRHFGVRFQHVDFEGRAHSAPCTSLSWV